MKRTISATAAAAVLLLASTAASLAADLPVRARSYAAPAPIWTLTGLYIGAHVGAGWGTTESTLTAAPFIFGPGAVVGIPISQGSRSGFLGGAQAGYNWQAGWAVFGVQGDIAGTSRAPRPAPSPSSAAAFPSPAAPRPTGSRPFSPCPAASPRTTPSAESSACSTRWPFRRASPHG